MNIAIVHNRVSDEDSPDAKDVLLQVDAVSSALHRLGHGVETIACTLDLETMRSGLERKRPDLVFNLVEDLGGYGRLIHLFPFILDALGIEYTGSPAEAIMFSSHKTMAKEIMLRNGLPTPAWVGPYPAHRFFSQIPPGSGRWIIKSVWEHASIGLDETSVVETDSPLILTGEFEKRCDTLGGTCFAEEYIEGREFNLSLLAGPDGPEVLPPAEIIFEGYTPDMVRIVDYGAKWEEDSHGYHHTPRSFDFGDGDANLLDRLRNIAKSCWREFGLAGYARV
ncbi:MAG: D-alanine--D-alanine ligase, partial [Desulfobulbaceae bacterium]|nr:D-alanine--D-alanine ligase [Desulfobulbaceae bacterium]